MRTLMTPSRRAARPLLRWSLFVALLAPAVASGQEEPVPDALEEPAETSETVSIEEARSLIAERSLELQLSEERIEQAELLESQARAVLLPTVNLSASYTLNDQSVEFSQPNTYAPLAPYLDTVYQNNPELQEFFENNPDVPDARVLAEQEFDPVTVQFRHDYRVTGTVTQTVYNARAFPLLRLAYLSQDQAENGREQVLFQLEATVDELYFSAVAAQRFVRVAEENLEIARLNYDQARIAAEEQVGTRFEATRAEVAYTKAQRDLENARLSYQLSIDALATLLNVEPDFDVVAPEERPVPESHEPFVDDALQHRPDVEGAELAIEYEEERLDETRAKWIPNVFAQAQAYYQRASEFSGENLRWNVSLNASWDLYDGGLRTTERRSREHDLVQAEIEREQVADQIESEIRQTHLRLQSQQTQVQSARSEVELARENLELTEEAREIGTATQLDLDIARSNLFLAEMGLADAEVRLQALIYQLHHLSGTR